MGNAERTMQRVRRCTGVITLLLFLWSLGLNTAVVFASPLDMDSAEAAEEFRWGVVAYHNGFFNEAILSFSRALSLSPDNTVARLWLGHAFYRSGFEEEALTEWQTVVDRNGGDEALRNQIEMVRTQRGVTREIYQPERYVVSAEIQGVTNDSVRFRRPMSVRPRPDGSFYVTSFSEHEILHIDTNGAIRRRLRGGLVGFNHPFDILEVDARIYVSEFGADRVARINDRGEKIATFGESGIGNGQLLGPQYLAADADGYLYVTDYGNRRVVKFDPDGEYVLSFGRQRGAFEGFERPTGIIVHRGEVYVADQERNAIFRFDVNGNFIGAIRNIGMAGPEALSLYDDRHLLIADTSGGVMLELDQQVASRPADFGSLSGIRITSLARDANGNLVAADFDRNKVYFLADLSGLYAGLHVRVDRIYAEDFPEVLVEVAVFDRMGRPIVGLDSGNFLLTDGAARYELPPLAYAGYRGTEVAVSVLVDGNPRMTRYRDALAEAVGELYDATDTAGRMRLVSAGRDPAVVAPTGSGRLTVVDAARQGPFEDGGRFDTALRLAASELIPQQHRRGVVFATYGELPVDAFEEYGLNELAAYLRNNHVTFSVVTLRQGAIAPELEHLVRETGGTVAYVYESPGVERVIDRMRRSASGRYILRYTSAAETDFGRAYIPLSVETYLVQRSGRAESGYFGPLEF